MKYSFNKIKKKMRIGYTSASGSGIISVNHKGGMKSHNKYLAFHMVKIF